jgi:hypothetical protein
MTLISVSWGRQARDLSMTTDSEIGNIQIEHAPAVDIQRAAEHHLEACYDAMYDEADAPDSPAVGAFCGCNRCIVREVLAGAWPQIERYFTSKATA